MHMCSLVLDVGSYETKVGYSGVESPAAFPSTCGYTEGDEEADRFQIGTGKLNVRRDGMTLRNPYDEDGVVVDYDAMSHIWTHAFGDVLKTDVTEYPVLLSEPAYNTADCRSTLTEIMFETFAPPALFISKTPTLSTFQSGRSSALVIDCGHGGTTITPVQEGYPLTHYLRRSKAGGASLTRGMAELLARNGHKVLPWYAVSREIDGEENMKVTVREYPGTTPEYHSYMVNEVIKDIRESTCSVLSARYSGDTGADPLTYQLPDGEILEINDIRFQVPEQFFVNDHSQHFYSIGDLVLNAVSGISPAEFQSTLWSSVLLVGGSSLIPGFPERLRGALNQATPKNVNPTLISSNFKDERRFSAWVGGSILGSLSSFQTMWFSRAEYDEFGASYIEKKCP